MDNTVAASIEKYLWKGRLDEEKMDAVTWEWIKRIGCVPPIPKLDQDLVRRECPENGHCKWMNINPRCLFSMVPTVGVDIGSKYDIHTILHEFAKAGVGVIIISDDLSELYYNCNKLLVMEGGKSSGLMDTKTLTEEGLATLLHGNVLEK